MRLVAAGHILLAKRLQQLAAVVGEDVDRVERFVDDPHAPLGIVRTDPHAVRPRTGRAFAQLVPLSPTLFHVAIAVQRVEAIAPDTAVHGVEHVDTDGAGETEVSGRNRVWKPGLATLRDENAVGRLGEHTGIAAE